MDDNNGNNNQSRNLIIICIISILILIIGILCGFLFITIKKGKSSTNDSPATANTSADTINSTTANDTSFLTTASVSSQTTTVLTTASALPETTAFIRTTVAVTDPPQPLPTVSANFTVEKLVGQGFTYYLNISGNFSYYNYEIYWDGEGQTDRYLKSGTSSDSCLTFSASGTLSKMKAYITPYNSVDTAGERIYCEGELSQVSQYQVQPCTKYGTIKAGNLKIDGYTTSYVVYNGAESYERHDLTDGWHITAVNICNSRGTIWYELYDTDDGDYYGWVDSSHINFY